MPAYDYSAVADIYDDFCVFDGDIDFFTDLTATVDGPVLELMAGTGRVSLPLIRHGVRLACVDRFASMLAVLAAKLRSETLSATLVCADVCSLPFDDHFEMVILPFQGFTEIVGRENQRRVFAEAARVLPMGGRFICTSHNPAVRTTTIDGEWHEVGRFRLATGRELVLSLMTSFADRPEVVEGTQAIEIFGPDGVRVESLEIDLEFSLVAPQTLAQLAAAEGFHPLRWLGDYRGSDFDEQSSPSLIIEFEKREMGRVQRQDHS